MRNSHVLPSIAIAIYMLVALLYALPAAATEAEAEAETAAAEAETSGGDKIAAAKSPRSVIFVDADDNPHSIEEFAGEVVLVNLWATWCAPCVEEMPALNRLQRDYRERGLQVLTISEDFRREKAVEFMHDNQLNELTLYFDVASNLLRSYGVSGLPLSVLYDAQGNEAERFKGAIDWNNQEVRHKIEVLM